MLIRLSGPRERTERMSKEMVERWGFGYERKAKIACPRVVMQIECDEDIHVVALASTACR